MRHNPIVRLVALVVAGLALFLLNAVIGSASAAPQQDRINANCNAAYVDVGNAALVRFLVHTSAASDSSVAEVETGGDARWNYVNMPKPRRVLVEIVHPDGTGIRKAVAC